VIKLSLKNGNCVVIKSTAENQVYLSYDINRIRYEYSKGKQESISDSYKWIVEFTPDKRYFILKTFKTINNNEYGYLDIYIILM
jgi:predicted RNA-binding protein associated with RNAse of E/G family